MLAKSISSTEAQNNFGKMLDDAAHNRTRYIIERHNVPQAVLLSFEDFSDLLNNEPERQRVHMILSECRPEYSVGRLLNTEGEAEQEQEKGTKAEIGFQFNKKSNIIGGDENGPDS